MSKRRDTPGTSQLGIEVDADLLARWKAYVKGRKETLREAAERAFARDMANPPAPVPLPLLPPITSPVVNVEETKPAPKKGKGKK